MRRKATLCFGATALLGLAGLAGCDGTLDAIRLEDLPLTAGLVAHWAFDDGTGSSVRDNGGTHGGTVQGSTWGWLQQGRFAGALRLEQGDHVIVDGFPDATVGWTVAAWVYLPASSIELGEMTVISTEDVFRGGWEINLNATSDDRRYHFGFYSGPGSWEYAHVECEDCLKSDRWQHIAAVVDGTAMTAAFYLDGALHARTTIATTIRPGSPTLYMGRWATTDPPRLFAGSLDDVAVWNRRLASAEIELLQDAPVP